MTYTQYRLARKNGQIILQERKMTPRPRKWYQFWHETVYDHTEWVESVLPEVT